MVVSLNGADNVGKTTQIGLLPRSLAVHLAPKLQESDERLRSMEQNHTRRKWWWDSSHEDFVSTLFAAVASRFRDSLNKPDVTITVHDRGTIMFQAVATAMIATKSDNHDLGNARSKFTEIIKRQKIYMPEEKLKILLKHSTNLEESISISLEREERIFEERYRLYQALLQTELQHQESQGLYDHVVFASKSLEIRTVQDQIRSIINRYLDYPLFKPVMHNIECIYAFDGLTKSGKSSLADGLCSHYGSGLAFRGKIIYFADQASEKIGKSIQGCSQQEQAVYLFHELEKFTHAHYWLKTLTVESLHWYECTVWLQKLLDDKLRIIFVDTSKTERLRRSVVSPHSLEAHDTMKIQRGADRIRHHADLILDNNGPYLTTVQTLVEFSGGNTALQALNKNST